jgi:4-hydroxyphenylpyruvate dioxygenase-like putative hemolysin
MFEIDHVAAAVEDADEAVTGFVEATDAEHVLTIESDEWHYRTAYLLADDDMFTLISPLSEESFMHDFIERRGPGFHHIGVNVDDLDATAASMAAMGGEVIMEDHIEGVRTEKTFHPNSWFGLQIQLIEWDDGVEDSARGHIEAMRTVKD